MQAKQTIINKLTKTVQHNCHIADATHASDYTLCIYLLKMRELFRWEHAKPFSTNLPNETVGTWLQQREELWNNLEGSDYLNIEVGNKSISPFESNSINKNLQKHQLVYSGGMGINKKNMHAICLLHLQCHIKRISIYVKKVSAVCYGKSLKPGAGINPIMP